MTRAEVFERLNRIFRNVFDDEDIVVDDSTTVDDIEDWDSFEHINLLVAIEHGFGIKFNVKETKKFENVGAMVDAIMEKLVTS